MNISSSLAQNKLCHKQPSTSPIECNFIHINSFTSLLLVKYSTKLKNCGDVNSPVVRADRLRLILKCV